MEFVAIHLQKYGRSAYAKTMGFFSPQMTPTLFFLDFWAYPPIILLSIILGYITGSQSAWWHPLAFFLSGYGVWTLVEYVMHRFILHHVPGIVEHHMAHHADALELIGTPTIYSITLLIILAYAPMAAVAGYANACFWFAGMALGYLAFAAVHYVIHHNSAENSIILRKLKRMHAIHHYGKSDYNFGVTTLVWDRVFGTYSSTMR